MILGKSNQRILKELDELVFGHRQAKIALINLVNRSKMRYHQLWHTANGHPAPSLVSNINCLLIGQSGTGKTHLVQSLAKICDFPLFIVDATRLTPTGNGEGYNADRFNHAVRHAAIKYRENAEQNGYKCAYSLEGVLDQMIVFVDEFDKLAGKYEGTNGSWNKHTQTNFLTIFENNSLYKNLSFIFAGAFSGMPLSGTSTKKSIGFSQSNDTENNTNFDLEEEVIKYGIIPELAGRIHNIVALDKLESKDYESILNNFVLPSLSEELKHFNIKKFKLTKQQKEAIINKAMKSSTGVRLLKKEVTKLSQDLEFDFEYNFSETPTKRELDIQELIENKPDK